MVQKVVILTSGTAWKVPRDWNNSNNTVYCWGAGGAGTGSGGLGGGGGACAYTTNVQLTPGSIVPILVAATGDTKFNTNAVVAKGASGSTGGQAAQCIGSQAYSGGTATTGNGAGAGGTSGNGAASITAGTGPTFTATIGGATAKGGNGGAAGNAGWSESDNYNTYYYAGEPGSPGANYGGGGGGGGSDAGGGGGAGAAGAPGVIVIVYDGNAADHPFTFVSVGSRAVTSTASVTASVPSGTADKDMLLAVVTYRNNAATGVTQSGGTQTWTQIYHQTGGDEVSTTSGKTSMAIFQLIRDTTAPSNPSFAMVGNSGSVLGMSAQIVAYRGPDFIISASGEHRLTTASSSFSMTGPTGLIEGSMILFFAHAGRASGTINAVDATVSPSVQSGSTSTSTSILLLDNWTERADSNTTTGADSWSGIFDGLVQTLDVGNITLSSSAAAMWAGVYLVFSAGSRMMVPEFGTVTTTGIDAKLSYSGYTPSRILIGNDWNEVKRILISRNGVDAGWFTTTNEDLVLNSDWPALFPIYITGTTTCTTSADTTINFTSLGYVPLATCFWYDPVDGRYDYNEFWQNIFFFAFYIYQSAPKVKFVIRDGSLTFRNRTDFNWYGNSTTRTVYYTIFRVPLYTP